MKKLLTFALMAVAGTLAQAGVTIDGTEYAADTIVHRQVGPGIVNTIVRIPDYPLNVYVLETDVTNPNNRIESTIGYNQVGKTELLTNAAKRLRTPTKRPVAGCNANFWIVSASNAPLNAYGLGTTLGGVVRNDTTYVNSPQTIDAFDGGPSRTGVAAITRDKRLYVGRMAWTGIVASSKLDSPLSYTNINRRCLNNDLALWNVAYTRTREFEDNWTGYNETGDNQTDNYYLMVADGSGWGINKDMKFVVASIVKGADRQTLGNYDACLTATGTYKTAMAAIAVGDTLTITSNYTVADPDRDAVMPDIENLVEGNAYIMHNGEVTERNSNETYNSQVYSRTCYGSNADGTRLYMLVIDKSTSKLYGRSAGCNTATACQILKSLCPDVTEIANFDAGGSAEMLVDGEIINTTTESNPRAVASGWIIEAIGEEDNEIASIQFDLFRIITPIYSSLVPRILGFNAAGELINDDVKGFTLTCDAARGTTADSVFTANGDAGEGTLTATLNGMTATVRLTTMPAQPAIRIRPTILTDNREYAVEVTATVDNKTYSYDPTKLEWEIEDPSIATITGGTLQGVSNGRTRLFCNIGEYSDTDSVCVEISPVPYRYQDWDGWTLKGSGATDLVLDSTGVLSYTYSSARAPYISLKRDITFYGLPDSIAFDFTSSLPLSYIQVDVRNNEYTSINNQKFGEDSGFVAGQPYTIYVDLDQLGTAAWVGTYPITLKEIKFTPDKSQATTGAQTITLTRIRAHYPGDFPDTLLGDVNLDGKVDSSDIACIVNIITGKDPTGTYDTRDDINGDGSVNSGDIAALVSIITAN